MKTLGDELPKEITRIRDVVILQYLSIGPASTFAVTLMRAALDRASKAMIEGDVVEMLSAYQDLKSFE